MSDYNVIGLMSGSSLDGLDIAFCNFKKKNNKWHFIIKEAICIPFTKTLKQKLISADKLPAKELIALHHSLGAYFGKTVQSFIKRKKIKADFISSHGHTIFHHPEKGFTTQIGDGAKIATLCNLPVVCDLRSTDIALGGQGAPIVPIGDLHLFSEYDFCLNIGGIANISYKSAKNKIVAFDICPANQLLNHLAKKLGKEFDHNGLIARSGKINQNLFKLLNNLSFYKLKYPKSISNQWVVTKVAPIIYKIKDSIPNKLHTVTEHIAYQTAQQINSLGKNKKTKVLVTGGGTFNQYLIERITSLSDNKLIIPNEKIIKFKEALVMAFIGVLRIRNEINVLKSVTGARKDTVNGSIYS